MAETNLRLTGYPKEQSRRHGSQQCGGKNNGRRRIDADLRIGMRTREFKGTEGIDLVEKTGIDKEKEGVEESDIVTNIAEGRAVAHEETKFEGSRVRRGFKGCGYRYHTPSLFECGEDNITPSVLWEGLVENTTVHGLPNYYKARGTVKKCFWVVAMLLMTIGLCYNLEGLTANYLRYPVNVAISLVQQQQLVFPAATICNLNPVRKSALDAISVQRQTLAKIRRKKRSSALGGCPGGWQYNNNSCYLVTTPGVVTDCALALVSCMGPANTRGSLVSISDQQENDFVMKLIGNFTLNDYWIGLFRSSSGNTTYWYDGNKSPYRNFSPGEPDGSGYCIRMVYGGLWKDTVNTSSNGYVCKGPADFTTSGPVTTASATTRKTTKPGTKRMVPMTIRNTTQDIFLPNVSTTAKNVVSTTRIITTPADSSSIVTTLINSVKVESNQETSTDVQSEIEHSSTVVFSTVEQATAIFLSTADQAETFANLPTIEQTTATNILTGYPSATANNSTGYHSTTANVSTGYQDTTTILPTDDPPTDAVFRTVDSIFSIVNQSTSISDGTSTEISLAVASSDTAPEMRLSSESSATLNAEVSNQPTASSEQFFSSSSTFSSRTKSLPTVGCCCQCCITANDQETCITCTNDTLEQSSQCAAHESPRSASTPSPSTTPVNTSIDSLPLTDPPFTAPPMLNGSSFPERTAFKTRFLQGEDFLEMMAGFSEKEKLDMGHSLESMVLECRYGGEECSASDFETFYNPLHGNCYVFNSGWNRSKTLRLAKHSGRKSGLRMVLNINQRDYIPKIGESAGLRLVLLPQREMAFPEDEGITLSPGLFTSVAIKQLTTILQPYPYGTCTDGSLNDPATNVYASRYPVNYSKRACLKTCLHFHVIKECSCFEAYMLQEFAFDPPNLKPCSLSNITQDDCRYSVTKLFSQDKLSCDCPDLCKEVTYTHKLSFNAWPAANRREKVIRRLSIDSTVNSYLSDTKVVSDNLVPFELFFDDLSFEILEETPAYVTISFVSDIGAVLGLWFGFAALTFVEFLELFFDTSVLAVRKTFLLTSTK